VQRSHPEFGLPAALTASERVEWSANSLFLTGPTASGKTALALEIASRIGAEIVSMDSMAIYRGMDIGTAKPSSSERAFIRHHLVDAVDPWEEFSLAQYLAAVDEAVGQIAARGKVALFVGGTPLYLKSLLYGVDSGPPPNHALRSELDRLASLEGIESLHDRLARVDPAAAQRIHRNDLRRIVRAIEVFESTGIPISDLQKHFHEPGNPFARVFCLDLPRAELYRRIDERVRRMFDDGLVAEVQGLMALPRPLSRTARQAVGYREVMEHLAGQCTLADAVERVQRRSRQFSKRQLTWFRSMPECRLLPVDPDSTAQSLADHIDV
jgi:tRNA dimethylallyltransferase